LGSITNVESCTQDTKSCTAVVKAAMNKKQKTLFTSKLDIKLRNKLVKCYIWRTALCGEETLESGTEILGKF
jgi:predicted restriction endonuclease